MKTAKANSIMLYK